MKKLVISAMMLGATGGILRAADILSDKSFKWHVVIRPLSRDSKPSELDFSAPVNRAKLPTPGAECFLSILPMLKTDPRARWEQSVNLTCNSFTTGALCRAGDRRNGWVSGIVEKKSGDLDISVTCDQFEGSSFHESFWDQISDLARGLWS